MFFSREYSANMPNIGLCLGVFLHDFVMCRILLITAQRDDQPMSKLNKSFIENPSTQKNTSPHLQTFALVISSRLNSIVLA